MTSSGTTDTGKLSSMLSERVDGEVRFDAVGCRGHGHPRGRLVLPYQNNLPDNVPNNLPDNGRHGDSRW